MNLIKTPLVLKGQMVELVSLDKAHFDTLEKLATEEKIWQFYPFDLANPEKFKATLPAALEEREKGSQFPFTIFYKEKIIGSTRYMDIQPKHKKLEIGFTWMHPDYWGSGINTECKFLLLQYCFDYLEIQRVHIKTDEMNVRSRKAIEKIGGQFEGIIRNDMVRDNGTKRNSASYSIIDQDWQHVKVHLLQMLGVTVLD
ncbi:GNAT family N-acetyltransferase [Xanthocytophaga flava]|uniref:GNAT family N-acetyltransferase n=1 Tax=Xanthocytophaga flava TaxID=3048013 RepID=UPI0028D1FC58|nr:GNAT family protein [Xanthocytophaga flavus]MDJ1468997.1 GNAT family protein [Xanthocytophaga flavus]